MTNVRRFLASAAERAEQKNMDVDIYLCKQIKLSALALEEVAELDDNSSDSVAVAFDVAELTDAAERLESIISAEYEQK